MKNHNSDFIYDIEEKLKAMRHIRLDAGYTQEEVATLLGLNKSQISRWEKGEWRKSKHIQTFIQLIRLLDNLQLQAKPTED